MAADENVISAYLIKLGYSVDKVQQSAFETAAGKAGKVVGNVTSGILAGFATITGLGTAAAVSMDKLYIASRRAGTDPLIFRSYTEGFRQIGGQAEAMSATLQNIGVALKDSPAARVFSEGLVGKPTTNAVETLEGLLTFYEKLVRENPNGSDVLARNLVNTFASQLGADPDTIRQILLDPEGFRRGIRERSAAAKSAGLTNADIRSAFDVTNQFKSALDDLFIGLMKVSLEAFPIINAKLAEFDKWFRENPQELGKAIDLIGAGFKRTGEALSAVGSAVGPFFDFLKWLDSHGVLGIVLGAAGGFVVGGVPGAVAGATVAAAGKAYFGVSDYLRAQSATPAGVPQDDVSFFQGRLNLTREQAAGLVGNLGFESGAAGPQAFNLAGGGRGAQGLAQWRGDRIAAAEKFVGGPVLSASREQQREFVVRELQTTEFGALERLRQARDVAEATLAVRRYYERPSEAEANDAGRLLYAQRALGATGAAGGAPLRSQTGGNVLQSKVEINVNATNAASREIGNAVELGTERVMQDAIRNFADRTTAP